MPLTIALGRQKSGGSLWVRGQAGLQSEIQDSQVCAEKYCFKKKNPKKKKKKIKPKPQKQKQMNKQKNNNWTTKTLSS